MRKAVGVAVILVGLLACPGLGAEDPGEPRGKKSPMPWAEIAPPVAGLPTMTDGQAVRFMMTGEKPDGSHGKSPMPEYRLTPEDAKAVVVFLKSSPPKD